MEEETYEATAINGGMQVFVGRLAGLCVTRQAVRDKFSAFGPLTHVRLYNRGLSNVVDAHAHVGFARAEDAWRCIQALDGATWLGQVISVQPLQSFLPRAMAKLTM